MIRKLLLTGVIVLFDTGTLQIWFGTLVSAISLIVYLQVQPYNDLICGYLQIALHVALTMTYLTSSVLIPRQYVAASTTTNLRFVLVAVNFMLAVLILFISISAIMRLRKDIQGRRLTYVSGGGLVTLMPPSASSKDGFHLFLSHVWAHGQDQERSCWIQMRTNTPHEAVCPAPEGCSLRLHMSRASMR